MGNTVKLVPQHCMHNLKPIPINKSIMFFCTNHKWCRDRHEKRGYGLELVKFQNQAHSQSPPYESRAHGPTSGAQWISGIVPCREPGEKGIFL